MSVAVSRPRDEDRALCLHEAAHAVVAEIMRPGCMLGIQMDYVPGEPDAFIGMVYGDDVSALCSWKTWYLLDPGFHVACLAGREGEKIDPVPGMRFDGGDRKVIRRHSSAEGRRVARRHASSIVRRHELTIRRLAKQLRLRRTMTGDEIREVINAYPS